MTQWPPLCSVHATGHRSRGSRQASSDAARVCGPKTSKSMVGRCSVTAAGPKVARQSTAAPSQEDQVVSILSQYCIYVSDIERAIEFWRDVAGIPLVSETDIPNHKEAILQSPHGGSRLQLAQK